MSAQGVSASHVLVSNIDYRAPDQMAGKPKGMMQDSAQALTPVAEVQVMI